MLSTWSSSLSYRQRGAQNGQVIARLAVKYRWIADSHHQLHQHTKAPYVSLRDNVAARRTLVRERKVSAMWIAAHRSIAADFFHAAWSVSGSVALQLR